MGAGRSIPRASATKAFTKGVEKILKSVESETKALRAKANESPSTQHGRFLDMAKEVGASTHTQDFDKAFSMVTKRKG